MADAITKNEKHIVVWYGQIGCQWIVSLEIEPGIRQRITSDVSKLAAIAPAEIEATMRGLEVKVIEPKTSPTGKAALQMTESLDQGACRTIHQEIKENGSDSVIVDEV